VARHGQHVDLAVLVGEGDLLAVRGPGDPVEADRQAVGELLGLGLTRLVDGVDLLLARGVGDVGDLDPVRGPDGVPIVGSGGAREVAHRAVLDGHGVDVAPRHEQGTLAVGREVEVLDVVRHRDVLGAGGERVRGHVDGDGVALAGGDVVDRQLTTQLVDDPALAVVARPAHVPGGRVGELLDAAARDVVGVEVQRAVAVRGEVDRVADPHGVAVGPRVVRHPRRVEALEVEDPQVLGPAALVALPAPEVPGLWAIDDLLAVGREVAGAGDRHGQGPR
jgi:hypothetical protein